jgi:predicted phosphodiesterase
MPRQRNQCGFIFLLFLLTARIQSAASFASTSNPTGHHDRPPTTLHPDQQLRLGNSIHRQQGVILVDVENVRGKSGFALTHADMMEKLSSWTAQCRIEGQVILIADHGNSKDAYWTSSTNSTAHAHAGALAIVFSGNHQKADDVIANDIGKIAQWANEWNQNKPNDRRTPIMVVTDDQGLLGRCRKTTARKALQVVTPLSLLEELEPLKLHRSEIELDARTSQLVQEASDQITMAAEWMLAYSKVKAIQHKHVPNKRRQALQERVTKWKDQLEASDLGKSLLQYAQAVMDGKESSSDNTTLAPELQSAVIAAWEKLRDALHNTKFQKENTGDRVVSAEEFRAHLQREYQAATQTLLEESTGEGLPPAQRYVHYWNWIHSNNPATSNRPSTLKLVVISDTHGFERDLPPLPKGDVLLHLGDFALEGPAKEVALETFDSWLAEQPHPHKVVLRGNHDPRSLALDRSGALFVTAPRTVSLGGFSVALVPFLPRVTTQCLPSHCHVVASHVPPKGILDQCTTGKLAGCNALKKRLHQMSRNGKAPKVLICGHIHEARGCVEHNFGLVPGEEEKEEDKPGDCTLVLNVANANPGIAERIVTGPVVVELTRENEESGIKVEYLMAEDLREGQENSLWQMYDRCNGAQANEDDTTASSTSDVLLIVSLGLKCGISLFNHRGDLLGYKRFVFPSTKIMKRQAEVIVEGLKDEVQGASITHLALMGSDSKMRKIWNQAVFKVAGEPKKQIAIDANEWRKALLTSDEVKSSQNTKSASITLAQKVISKFGVAPSSSAAEALPMEVVESVLAGLYSARKLGLVVASTQNSDIQRLEVEQLPRMEIGSESNL